MSRQFARSGTATGALLRESNTLKAEQISSINLSIGLKEGNETEYWIELMQTSYIDDTKCKELRTTVEELNRMLISSLKR